MDARTLLDFISASLGHIGLKQHEASRAEVSLGEDYIAIRHGHLEVTYYISHVDLKPEA